MRQSQVFSEDADSRPTDINNQEAGMKQLYMKNAMLILNFELQF